MTYDFDEICERHHTNSIKWDAFPKDVLPMWVADMDFKSPPEIREALQKLTDLQVYGYSKAPELLLDVIIDRMKERHAWDVKKEWLVLLPGLVPGLHAATRIFDETAVNVLTSIPVYYHLSLAGKYANHETKEVPFVWHNEQWEMDFEKLQEQVNSKSKMFLLCNPHNPNGRVFSEAELRRLSSFCIENKLILVSDEIHCDLIIDENYRHISIATLDEEIAMQSITLLAPSKTFNIAGLGGSFAIIPNPSIRKRFKEACFGIMPYMSSLPPKLYWQLTNMVNLGGKN